MIGNLILVFVLGNISGLILAAFIFINSRRKLPNPKVNWKLRRKGIVE